MTNKSIPSYQFAPENASGIAWEWSGIASALPRKLLTLLFCLLFIGVGNAWGAYSATFIRISSISELSAGDSVLVVIQDAKTPTSGYAVQNNSTNYSSVTIATATNSITCTNAKCVWKVAKSNSNWQFVRGTQYIAWTSSTTVSATATGNTNTWTIADISGYSGYLRIKNTGTGTRDLAWGSQFKAYANTNYVNQMATSPAVALKQYDGALSIYKKQTCTALGSINGSVSWSNGTSATLTWNSMSNVDATTPYTVTYRTGSAAYGDTNVGSITTNGAGKKTCTITGLTAGTSYDFKIAVTAASNYCDKDSVMTAKAPKITTTTDANLVDVTYAEGDGPSTNASYFTFSGVGLTGDVTVTAPTNFLVSKTNSSSGFDGSVTVSPSTGSISDQKIWIRLASGLTNASSPYGGNVALSGGGAATVNVAITGSVSSACTAPTVETPTLANIASGTITPSCASVTVDDNCDVTDYGFVWKASSDPTIDDNKTSLGDETPASAFSSDLSISFTTGNTYKIKAYAINSAGTTLSSSLQVTPQSVTFNSNGGSSVTTKYVNNGGTVSKPSDPTKSNYDFDDWYTDDGTFKSSVDFSSTITDDVTYYANWTETLHDVTVEYKCGSTTVKASTTIKDVGVVTTGNTTAPNDITGYTWSTWSAMPSGVTTSTTPLTTRTITINATADSKTITANYTANQYAITYKDEGDVAYSGNNSGSLPSTHTYGSATALVNGAKSGYDFLGWYTDDDCTISAGASIGATAVTAAFTLYAKWAPSKYDVTLIKNGKTAAADQVVRVTYGSAMPDTIKAVGNTAITVPTQNGYTFKGYWDTSASTGGTQYYSYTGTPAALGSARNWDKTSDTNLFGRWEANVYTITLDANEGTLGETTSVTATFDQDMPTIDEENLPTREGYRFDGFWAGKTTGDKYYNADGTSAKKQARWSADQKLYARWVAQTTFSVNGSIVPALTIDDNAAMPSATVPTTCGDCWAFLGWSEDSEESSAIDYASGDTHTFGTPTTLYAVFGQTEYKMINSTSGLVANDNYVIASSSDLALSNADHSYYSTDAASLDISSISRVNAGSISVYNPTSNIIWKFTGTYSSGQLYNTAASKYVNLDAAKVLDASSQNLTFSVNDDGETWTIKSSTPKYLHGYVDGNGDGFESLTSSYWDEDEDFSAYILHQTSSTVTTTPSCETYDIVWKVGNDEASGTPTDNTTTCTGIEELPDDPDDNALDCATKFMGWSESILTGEGKSAPADLFTTAGGAPKIDEDKTFHAVFASIDTESEESASVTSTFTSTTWGDENSLWSSDKAATNTGDAKGVQVNKNESGAGATTKDSYNKVSSVVITYGSASSAVGSIAVSVGGTAMTLSSGSISGGQSDQTLTYTPTAPATYLSGVVSFVATVTNKSVYIKSIQINYKSYGYKDYMTICCDNSVTIGTPTITGSGTVTFTLGGEDLDPGDDVETCTSAKDVVATVTPEAGYKCTSVSFTGVSVTIDPTPGSGNYPAAPSTQDYTLSFAKNTTSGTLATSATFEAKALEGWTWKYKKDADVADGSVDPYDIPDVVEIYKDQYARFIIDGYTPSDVISDKQGYVYSAGGVEPAYSTSYLTWVANTPTYFTLKGKAATESTTIVFKATGDNTITKTMTIRVKALPSVTFVDKLQDKTDFTNWGTDGVVSSTVTTGVVTHTKPTPSHADISDPGASYNACERQHLHLVGWIRSDWADEHPSATHSQITSVGDDDAGNPYYYTAGADIDVEAQNGKTFYAVWSKIE